MRRGLTLIEVLIVVVVLATLAAIVLPSFAGASDSAREAAAAAMERDATQRMALHVVETGERPNTVPWQWYAAGPSDWSNALPDSPFVPNAYYASQYIVVSSDTQSDSYRHLPADYPISKGWVYERHTGRLYIRRPPVAAD